MKTIVIGGGFGGVYAAKLLSKKGVEVRLISENERFLYTPLLHQGIFGKWSLEGITLNLKNTALGFSFVRDRALSIDSKNKLVKTKSKNYSYDKLIIATGATNCFYGVKGAKEYSFVFKNLEDGIKLRKEIDKIKSVVIVGGGATGVELAGELAELGLEVELIEGGQRLLKAFPKYFSKYAEVRLIKLGVKISKEFKVKEVRKGYVQCEKSKHHADMILWTAGVQPATIDVDNKKMNVYDVNDKLELAKDIYALGDVVNGYPKLAQTAVHQAKIVVHNVLGGSKQYMYKLQGLLLSVGSGYALMQAYGGLRFSGRIGWLIWNFVYAIKFLQLKFRIKIIKDCFRNCFV